MSGAPDPATVDGARDPFRVLSLPYDAGPDAVRDAFRRRARETHPDRGGSAEAFHRVRVAYGALAADLDRERQRWQAPAPPTRAPNALDARAYPTCTVRLSRPRGGARQMTFDTDRRPTSWRPGAVPPPGGACRARVEATEAMPAFGVWTVPLRGGRFRCVFGPAAAGPEA